MWAHTAKSAKVGPADATVMLFMFIWLFHMSWLTFKIAWAGIFLFVILAYFRVSFSNALGWIMFKISGGGMAVSHENMRHYIRRTRF